MAFGIVNDARILSSLILQCKRLNVCTRKTQETKELTKIGRNRFEMAGGTRQTQKNRYTEFNHLPLQPHFANSSQVRRDGRTEHHLIVCNTLGNFYTPVYDVTKLDPHTSPKKIVISLSAAAALSDA